MFITPCNRFPNFDYRSRAAKLQEFRSNLGRTRVIVSGTNQQQNLVAIRTQLPYLLGNFIRIPDFESIELTGCFRHGSGYGRNLSTAAHFIYHNLLSPAITTAQNDFTPHHPRPPCRGSRRFSHHLRLQILHTKSPNGRDQTHINLTHPNPSSPRTSAALIRGLLCTIQSSGISNNE